MTFITVNTLAYDIGMLALVILLTVATYYLTYLCIKNAVRDGIRESGGLRIATKPPGEPTMH